MAEKKTSKKTTRRPAKRTPPATKKHEGFTADERAAMKERARELKAAAAGAGSSGSSCAVGRARLLVSIASRAAMVSTHARR